MRVCIHPSDKGLGSHLTRVMIYFGFDYAPMAVWRRGLSRPRTPVFGPLAPREA